MRLQVSPDSDRVEQALIDASRGGSFVDARGVLTFAQLVDRCEAARASGRSSASPFVAQCVLGRVAPSLAREAFGDFSLSPEFARAALELISHLKSQNVTVPLLRDAAGAGEGTVRHRGLAIAALWEAMDTALETEGVIDRADLLTLSTARLLTDGLPPRLRGFDEIEVAFVHDLFPARLAFLAALAKACRKASVRFMLTWPGAGRDEVDVFIAHAIRHIEQRWELDPHDLVLHRTGAPLEWVSEQLFAPEPRKREAPSLTAFSAASARDEARELARRIKQLMQAGVAPEQVAVVFRDLASDTETVIEAFEEIDVPVRARVGLPLTASAVGRLALSLLTLREDSFPSGEVAAWLSSRYAKAPVACAADALRWLAEAGIRDDSVGRDETEGAYAIRLRALEQRFEAQLEALSPGSHRSSLEKSLAALRSVKCSALALISIARAIPERARYRVLLDAWWLAVQGVGVFASLDGPEPRGSSAFLTREVDRALARDQAAADALCEFRVQLIDALDRSGLAQVDVERAAFSTWLTTMASAVNLAARGVRTAAVWLLDAREIAGRQFEHVFVGGLIDGRFPGRSPPLPLLGEDQRKQLNAFAKQPLFRLGVAEGDFGLPLRLAEDRLLFHQTLSAARGRVVLSRARFDGSGRAALASPFLDALGRAVEGFRVDEVTRASASGLDAVMSEADLRVRVALEVAGPAETRQTVRDGRREALAKAFGGESWLVSAQAAGSAESERLGYFSDSESAPGSFSGAVVSDEVLGPVAKRLAYGVEHPVSANELKEWANCGFQGLAKRVLALRKSNVQGEDLDQLGRGTLMHEVLREIVPVLTAAGLLGRPLSPEVINPMLATAVAAAATRLERERGTGHPQLWAIAKARAANVVSRYLESEVLLPIAGALPVLVETEFGKAWSPEGLKQIRVSAGFEGERDVYVTGKIDRLDAGPDVACAIDYKSNSASSSKQRNEAMFSPDFQLPLYALAVRQAYPALAVDAAWVGLRGRESMTLLKMLGGGMTIDQLLSMDPVIRETMAASGLPNLANAVHGLLQVRLNGDFGARPIDCGFCEFKAVCRIGSRRTVEATNAT